jgi:subtilisin family serine protease
MHDRRRQILTGLLLLAVASCTDLESPTEGGAHGEQALQAALQAEPGGEKVRVIVQVNSMGRAQSLAASLDAAQSGGNSRVLRTYDNFPLVTVEVSVNALQALQRAPGVLSVTPDIPEPPSLDVSLGVINADDVHALGWTGSGFTVAILDTGIDQNHPFFGNRIVSQACYSTGGAGHDADADVGRISLCPGNAASSTAANSADTNIAACNFNGDLCDHGTHVAGIAAGNGAGVAVANAQAAGVAPAANIIAIQVFTRHNRADDCDPRPEPCVLSYPSDQIAGLDRVFTLRNAFNIAAANMSLGGGQFFIACDALEAARKTAIDSLRAKNIATVISSGNDGFVNAVGAPACISTAVAVGATDNNDNVTRNRGALLALFAPGSGIWSSGSNGGFESKGGTSMAAPHVAGAWAVMRELLPNASVADILNRFQTTGVPITYDSNGTDDVTTPRLDLLAAIQTTADPPVLKVNNATVTVDEGQTATNGGTFASDDGAVTLSASVGTVIDEGGGAWSWSYATTDGPAQSQTVTITGTDQLDQDGEVTFALVVNNVSPSVSIDAAQMTSINEGDNLTVTAHFTDPGTLDTHTATVTCHSVGGAQTVPGTINVTSVSPVIAGTVTAVCPYGDRSAPTFAVGVSVVDKDSGEGKASSDLTVANVDPTVAIDKSGATLINGVPAFIAQIGVPLSFDGNATDPGSDDIEMKWDWADGNTTTTMYLVNPPNLDPLPSPDVNPRDVDDTQSHTWVKACMFAISLTATDDDGGVDSDGASVIIAGNSGRARSLGYWQTEFRGRTSVFDGTTLDCYLAIAGFMSAVFNEVVDASTQAKAAQVLHPRGQNSMLDLLDAQLLAAWLNFANGAFGWDELVDTTGDKVPDTAFSTAVLAAEAVRLNPASTRAQLEMQKNILERINVMHE